MIRKACLAPVAALAATISTGALAFTPPPFPRLGGIEVSSPFDYDNTSYQAALARENLVVLNYYPGLSPGGQSMQSIVQAIKAKNPNVLVFIYVINNERDATSPAFADWATKFNSMHWWLYPQGTSGSPVPSSYNSNLYSINNTLFTAKDSSGLDAVDWMTHWYVDHYYAQMPAIDGFFMDNMFWTPRVDGDWDIAGSSISSTDPRAGTWERQGYARYVSLARQLMPGKYQIANVADWGAPQSVLTEYQGLVDGGVMESVMGLSYSIESYGGWQAMMTWYRKTMAALGGPKLLIFNQWGSPTDYQAMRYGLASCLMDNAYFNFTDQSQNYHGVVWFDEFNTNLGQATSLPPTAAWQSGVYRRDFENGIVLVNPKGNGAKTVTLETSYVKLKGSQAPSVNDGSTVTQVTLNDRDGIILLRKSPVHKPLPPTKLTAQQ